MKLYSQGVRGIWQKGCVKVCFTVAVQDRKLTLLTITPKLICTVSSVGLAVPPSLLFLSAHYLTQLFTIPLIQMRSNLLLLSLTLTDFGWTWPTALYSALANVKWTVIPSGCFPSCSIKVELVRYFMLNLRCWLLLLAWTRNINKSAACHYHTTYSSHTSKNRTRAEKSVNSVKTYIFCSL